MSETIKHDLFITSVWAKKLDNFEEINFNLLKHCFKSDEGSDENVYGGRETFINSNEWLKKVLDSAELLSAEIADFMGVLEEKGHPPRVSCFWGNINKQKEFNPPHVHPNSNLSGAYYVKIPESNTHTEDQKFAAGKICFHDTRIEKCVSTPLFEENLGYLELATYSSSKQTSHNPWLDNVAKFKPEEGLMIIFPSWLLHYVEPNLCDEDRIAISFNISF